MRTCFQFSFLGYLHDARLSTSKPEAARVSIISMDQWWIGGIQLCGLVNSTAHLCEWRQNAPLIFCEASCFKMSALVSPGGVMSVFFLANRFKTRILTQT
mmetsp:Transcript_25614/g.53349  ORF Transcript_25614/g.53349 Transcript_25614/m.53349 type:complete len:100 (-) Transcript_25614:119-418(-)